MNHPGRVHNGVVVLEGGLVLPEGAAVVVSFDTSATGSSVQKSRIDFPLVKSAQPGSLDLTNEQIAELLADEDVSS